jgi:CPA1 family monovalent cation:H+ antiporter
VALENQTGAEAENVRYGYLIQRDATNGPSGDRRFKTRREIGLAAIVAQREELERMRADYVIGVDTYLLLQEELDWNELTLLCDDERRIEES